VNKTLRRWLLFFLVAIIIQSAMGTAVRMYVDDVSKSLAYLQREKWLQQLPVVILGHRTFSWTLLALLLYGIVNYRKTPVKNGLGWLGFITVLNIVTGVVLFYANMPAFAQPVHVTLAAAIITQCCYLLFRTKTISAR
jgi:cytochrome c oxidase assembly protein subunit 15